jgi:UDP-N-acetylglucosamine diphosphorylase/glucosamine-1-phosphate N-acetyltransferase
MRAVVLAAGEGTRMRPLTYTLPKPMLPVAGKPILEHVVGELKKARFREIVMIVGYKRERVKEHFGGGEEFDVSIDYVEQKVMDGTCHAFLGAKEKVRGESFLGLNGDQLVKAKDLEKVARVKGNAIGAVKSEEAHKYGVLEVGGKSLKSIIEKPEKPPSNLINAGVYKFGREAFEFMKKTKKSARGEYEITDTIVDMVEAGNKFEVVVMDYWRDVGYPWQLIDVNEEYMENIETDIQGVTEDGVTIRGKVQIGEGTRVYNGTYIKGPAVIGKNCQIGPICYIRDNSVVGDNCGIGRFVEVKNSIIMNGTKMEHHTYVGDSVIGESCNFGAGTKCANLRFDDATVKMVVKGEKMDSGRRKLGTIMGSEAKTGVNCVLMPGVKIGNRAITGPNAIIYKDVPNNRIVVVKQELETR